MTMEFSGLEIYLLTLVQLIVLGVSGFTLRAVIDQGNRLERLEVHGKNTFDAMLGHVDTLSKRQEQHELRMNAHSERLRILEIAQKK